MRRPSTLEGAVVSIPVRSPLAIPRINGELVSFASADNFATVPSEHAILDVGDEVDMHRMHLLEARTAGDRLRTNRVVRRSIVADPDSIIEEMLRSHLSRIYSSSEVRWSTGVTDCCVDLMIADHSLVVPTRKVTAEAEGSVMPLLVMRIWAPLITRIVSFTDQDLVH